MENIQEKEKQLINVTIDDMIRNDGTKGKPLWTVIHNKVYDITHFNHPGGKDVFVFADEDDMDKGDEFDSIHGPAAKKQAEKYLIGKLVANDKSKDEDKSKARAKKVEFNNSTTNFNFIIYITLFVILVIIIKGGYLSSDKDNKVHI